MKEYLRGWQEEGTFPIPPVLAGPEETAVIRDYIPPEKHEAEDGCAAEEERTAQPDMAGDDAPTTLLADKVSARLKLLRLKTEEVLEIPEKPEGEPVTLGKGSGCDVILSGNRSLSRRHAEVFREGGVWFLRDLDSLNHTFAEGQKITEPVRLEDGMQIRLADEAFLVNVEISRAQG